MASSLIRRISSAANIGYGINIWEQSPVPGISGPGAAIVGVVADLPWGPVNEVMEITNIGHLLERHAPTHFGNHDDYAALKAFVNKGYPRLKVTRIDTDSAAKSAFCFQSVTPDDSVDVTALYNGLSGDLISVAWTVNDDDATARDATVTIGTTYSVKYLAVATIVVAALVVTDPGDPYVVFAKAAAATKVPDAIAATALAGGADGTATAVNYVGSAVILEGIRLFYGESVDVDLLFCAETPALILNDVNTGLKAYETDTDKGMALLGTVDGQTQADAVTYAADYRDDRLVYSWPRVKTTNVFDADLAEVEVNGDSWLAAAIANTDPWLSPGAGQGAPYLTGITGLEDETATKTNMDTLNNGGVVPWMMSSAAGGAIMRKAITTSTTSGLTKIRRRRMADYLENSIAAFMEHFVEQPLDLTLSTETLGPITGTEIGVIEGFLEGLKTKFRIKDYSVDPFSGSIQSEISAGRWTILISVWLYSDQDEIVLKCNIGDDVTITS